MGQLYQIKESLRQKKLFYQGYKGQLQNDKRLIHQESVTTLKKYALDNRDKDIKQKIKGEIDKFIVIVKYFNTVLSIVARISQKPITKDKDLNIINKLNLLALYTTLNLITVEYISLSSTYPV